MVRSLAENDDYTTPMEVWANIKQYLPTSGNVVVWESFYNTESKSADHLRELGCTVVYANVDFYTHDLGDVIVSNPPFSDKERVMRRLAELDKPFVLTLPLHSLTTRFVKRHFKHKLQIIIPDYRIHFERRTTDSPDVRKVLKRTPFETIYVCYKMNLPHDIVWL